MGGGDCGQPHLGGLGSDTRGRGFAVGDLFADLEAHQAADLTVGTTVEGCEQRRDRHGSGVQPDDSPAAGLQVGWSLMRMSRNTGTASSRPISGSSSRAATPGLLRATSSASSTGWETSGLASSQRAAAWWVTFSGEWDSELTSSATLAS